MKIEEKLELHEISIADESARISLMPSADQIPRLCTLMQKGCHVKVRLGCSLRELLSEQLDINPDYIKYEIKVFFINFSPVDDIDEARIRDGAVVALSASMPGLVGAAMRQGSLSWMRASITYHDQDAEQSVAEGVIEIKLFNQVMADLGESFLRRGVYVQAPVLADFLGRFPNEFRNKFNGITKNGEQINKDELAQFLTSGNGWVRFTIQ